MTAVVYPASLPGPSSWVVQGPDRRASSSLPGNAAHRARWRDRIVNVEAQWLYAADEMATWRAWYEDVLLYGQRRFAATVPGAGGFVERVLRHRTSSVRREALGNGTYRVSATLEQRGRAVAPVLPDWSITRTDTWLYKTEATPDANNGEYPLTDFDDSAWASGVASIGSASGTTYVSGWPVGSTTVVDAYPTVQELWLRKHTVVPIAGDVQVDVVNDDNGGSLWIDGAPITLSSVALWHQRATVSLSAGAHVFAVRVQNTGFAIYADLEAAYA
jgi:hypothetical protein